MKLNLILFLFFTSLLTKSTSSKNDKYDICSAKFSCGDKDDLGYPFYDGSTRPFYCGHPGFKLDCIEESPPKITISGQEYNLNKTEDADKYIITVSRNDTWLDGCPDRLTNTTMDFSIFNLSSTNQNITFFYDCQGSNDGLPDQVVNASCDRGSLHGFYLTQKMVDEYKSLNLFKNCKYIFIPVMESKADAVDAEPDKLDALISAFEEGFDLGLIVNNAACNLCMGSKGVSGYNFSSNKFQCHCDDQDYDLQCGVSSSAVQNPATTSKSKGSKTNKPIVIGVSMGVVVLLALLGGCLLIIQKSKRNPQNQSVEDSLQNYASLVPKRYAYKYIKKITKSFREKLGEGGYGTVFKGNLKDSRIVAVKVWKQSKGDGQDFLNEVMSISRTSHVNVVPLLGFCFEGHKRALIYEFMPNGSLEKFIKGRSFSENNQPLSELKLFEIGVGVARGLEYLHRGCNTRIVHFDIKPHNILLDAEFIPKISDFGLAKSSQQKESLISMSGARGTVGYIAPEVFFRLYGGVSHKSDVYSFGMMVLEMVGCKNKVNDNAENSSEMYFPQWIYKQLEQGAYTIDCERILNEEEKELERKMMLVGLWCIQTNPKNRPSMSRVVEMLEGKVELLEVPPMPTLCSPPRQQKTDEDSVSFPSSTTFVPTL